MTVKRAVIPCAGFGTRALPMTKAVAKELLPIADKPALHYIAEEAASSGIEEVLIIVSPQKTEIKRYFSEDKALNRALEAQGKLKELALVNQDFGVRFFYKEQSVMNGNGGAVLLAEEFAHGEPFAVLFGDDLIYTGDKPPVTKQLISAYEETGRCIVGCQRADEQTARRCGVMCERGRAGRVIEIDGVYEKPQGELPSDLVSMGRFILTPAVFGELKRAEKICGEIYLTSALDALAKRGEAAAFEFEGRRYDIGNKEGYLEAVVEYALRDGALGRDFHAYLKSITEE